MKNNDLTYQDKLEVIRPFDNSKIIVMCKEIVLKQGIIEITIDNEKIKQYNEIVIDGRTYRVLENSEDE